VPGHPETSEIIRRILSSDKDELMPPPKAHKPLTARQKEMFRRWVAQGAEYQKHWSYEPPVKAPIPPAQKGIDFLVGKRLTEIGLKPSPEADRRTLIRRLSFDLVGLPPSPEETATFLQDSSADAYEKLVDRLLASPHYGERMAIGWVDVVRFADTIGYHSDNPHNVWPYRDWVIQSFNDNKRFDRFTIEQIAGDLLPDATAQTRIGSAFNRLILSTEEGGAQAKDYEARMVTDRVRAVGAAWMGQTTGCAQCHDHKFDPFTARDFYSLGAFFADIQENALGKRDKGMPAPTLDQERPKWMERSPTPKSKSPPPKPNSIPLKNFGKTPSSQITKSASPNTSPYQPQRPQHPQPQAIRQQNPWPHRRPRPMSFYPKSLPVPAPVPPTKNPPNRWR
ncbi:MAG: DUF1549 domain-containing protein, partial [Verrucomicrobia bacterium]|nr:DUF1549 domain-containing protein [Verrucomicrobiota bacterium]